MLPGRKEIKDLFEGLLGREVAVTDGRPVDIGIPKPVIASYVDDDGHLRAVGVMSFGLAARSGAALALIPPGAVEAAEEDLVLPPNLFENAYEICNVLGEAGLRFFHSPQSINPSGDLRRLHAGEDGVHASREVGRQPHLVVAARARQDHREERRLLRAERLNRLREFMFQRRQLGKHRSRAVA